MNHFIELVESNFAFEELFFHFYKRQYKPKGSKWIIKERRHHPCRIYWPIVFQCQYSRYEKCALMADQCRKSCESANWVIHESRGLNNQRQLNGHIQIQPYNPSVQWIWLFDVQVFFIICTDNIYIEKYEIFGFVGGANCFLIRQKVSCDSYKVTSGF